MKWIGQHIYDLVSRFRDDVYLEDLTTTTETSVLVVDSTGKISKSTTLADDIIESEIDTLAGLTSFGSAGATTNIVAGDITMYNAVSDGNPTFSIGSDSDNRFEIKTPYNSGTTDLCDVVFTTYTDSSTTNDGRFLFYVDEVLRLALLDNGMSIYGTGNNVISSIANDAQLVVTDSTTSSATQGGKLTLQSDDGAAMGDDHRLGVIEFKGAEDASNNRQIGARIEAMCDASWSAFENGTRLDFYTMDGNASSELSLTLDSDLLATFAGAVTVTGALTGTLATVSQPNITTLAGVSAIGTASTALTVTSDTVTFTSANADDPAVTIQNTTNDAQGARLKFNKNRGVDGVDSDNVCEIEFWSYDDGTPSVQQYGKILCQIHDATSGEESGLLKFGVANEDGDVGYGLILTGGSANNEIDVTIGLGASSVTTISGALSCTGGITADVTGDLTGQADTVATIAGLAPNTATTQATQGNITTCSSLASIGTITTGVWQGTAIATNQQKHLAYFTFKGFSTSDGTNYEAIDSLNDGNAPYEHNSSIGSDGLTAQTVQVFMRMGGTVMPYAGTIKSWTGWATSAGSGTIDLGLFKYTPTRNDNSTVAGVLLKNTQFTALGNTKMEDFAETSFSVAFAAGDMIVSAIKGGTSSKLAFFDSTLEVEWD